MNDEKQLERLTAVTEDEWKHILIELKKHIYARIKGKTLYGAHSERELGVGAIDYYVSESIACLYELRWEWKEKYTLLDELKRICGSLISANVDKYKRRKERGGSVQGNTQYIDTEDLLAKYGSIEADEEDNTELTARFESLLEQASNGDPQLEIYAVAVLEFDNLEEISQNIDMPINDLYKLHRKLVRRCTSIHNKANYEE